MLFKNKCAPLKKPSAPLLFVSAGGSEECKALFKMQNVKNEIQI